MSVLTVIGCGIVWLIIFALILKFFVGGCIDVLTKGMRAGLVAWMGFAAGIIVLLVLFSAIVA